MNTNISTNGQHAIASSNGNGASLLKPGEPNERNYRLIQEQPQQASAVPNGGRGTRTKLLAAAIAGALAKADISSATATSSAQVPAH